MEYSPIRYNNQWLSPPKEVMVTDFFYCKIDKSHIIYLLQNYHPPCAEQSFAIYNISTLPVGTLRAFR